MTPPLWTPAEPLTGSELLLFCLRPFGLFPLAAAPDERVTALLPRQRAVDGRGKVRAVGLHRQIRSPEPLGERIHQPAVLR